MVKRIPSSIFVFIFIAILVFFLESQLLAPHLKYGFADVDWGLLYQYKKLGSAPFIKIFQLWKGEGVYTYQAYYMGVLEHFFPINNFDFTNIHKASNFFKFLSAISLFPLILILTGKKLLAALTTILYAVSYSSFGPIYAEAVSGNYLGITMMNLFLIYYIFIVKRNKLGILWIGIGILLFLLTQFLSTERMYPLIPLLFLAELVWLYSQRFSRIATKAFAKRAIISLSPFIVILALGVLGGSHSSGAVTTFFASTKDTIQKLSEGNWSVALTPLIAFGSTFLPRDYWVFMGSGEKAMDNFAQYVGFFLGPFFLFFIITSFLSLFISKKPGRFILLTSLLAFILGAISFILANHHLSINPSIRLPFDGMFLKPALIGAFVLALSLSSFVEWFLSDKKESTNLFIFLGSAMAFLFTFLTWVPASYSLIFEGVHRYLAIPAIGTSFFIAILITIVYEKLSRIKLLRGFSLVVFLLIIPIIQMNFNVVDRYFKNELKVAGMDGAEQIRVKSKMISYMGNFDLNQPTLIYFDEQDNDNGYFLETAIIAGLDPWIRFRGKSDPLEGITPQYIRNSDLGSQTNVYCTGQNVDCMSKLKSFVSERNGQKGIFFRDTFYPSERFYAFRLKDRDVLNIKNEISQTIGLN